MKRKILAMAIMLSLALGMAAVPMVGAEAGNDLLLGTGDFETENEAITWDLGMEPVTDAEGAKSGSTYLAVPEGGAEDGLYGVSVNVPVKSSTGYTLSFWVKCGSTRSGRVLIRSKVGGQQYSMAETSRSILGDDITVRFGNTVPEGATVSPWREVKRSFVTAPETDSILLQFYTQFDDTASSDMKMCIDNVKLTEGVDNLLMNGEMNWYMGNTVENKDGTQVPVPDEWTLKKAGGCQIYNNLQEDPLAPGSGNTYWQGAKNGELVMLNVPLAAGDYKISLRYGGWNGEGSPKIGCILQDNYTYLSGDNGNLPIFYGNVGQEIADNADNIGTGTFQWMNYSCYFTVPEDGIYVVGIGDRYNPGGHWYDDVVLVPADENDVYYSKPGKVSLKSFADTYSYGNFSAYRGQDVETIDDGAVSGTSYNLTVIGHYKAKNIQATEDFTLLSAIYKKNKESGAVSLYNVAVENGTTAPVNNSLNGENAYSAHNSSNIKVDISVPIEDDTYTYEVKSYLWSSVSGMKPVSKAFKLTY
ncbi:MAG: hypothetical protein E7408_03030 [Ruminococcaceae bacterium]|nr:hypothetical protein [Oscillospiraceae bacterium]